MAHICVDCDVCLFEIVYRYYVGKWLDIYIISNQILIPLHLYVSIQKWLCVWIDVWVLWKYDYLVLVRVGVSEEKASPRYPISPTLPLDAKHRIAELAEQ